MDGERLSRCRRRLIEVAQARRRITYGELASYLRVRNQALGPYLNAVYREEMAQGHPDLTLVVVYSDTGLGRYNSDGGPAQSVKVDPNNPDHVRAYREGLARVYAHWT